MYIYIGIKLCRQTPGTQQHPRRIGKVVCMMLINTAVFFLSNLFGIILEANVIEAIFGGSPLTLSGSILVTNVSVSISALINSSINTLVYSATNSTYRAAVVEAFSFLNCCHRQPQDASPAQRQQNEIIPTVSKPEFPQSVKDAKEHQENIELSLIGPMDGGPSGTLPPV